MKLTRAEIVLVSLTAAVCVFLLGFFAGRSGTRGVVTVQTSGLRAPSAAETPAETPEPEPDETGDASQEGEPESEEPDFPLDHNTATAEELTALPGIGEVLAQRIVDFRAENGPFRIIDELKDVRGIGDTIFDGLKDYITVG